MKTDNNLVSTKDQEGVYYAKILDLLSNKKLTVEKRRRLDTELKILRQNNICKILYVLYIITNKIKKDDQSYRLLGSCSNLLVLYLLGISNIDPFDKSFPYVLPYETAIGGLFNSKPADFTILVPDSYRTELIDYLKRYFVNDSDFYPCVDLTNEQFRYSDYTYAILPKNTYPYTFGDYIEAYGFKGFLTCFNRIDNSIRLDLPGSENVMPRESTIINFANDSVFEEVYSCFLDEVLRKGYSNSIYSLKDKYQLLDKDKMDIYYQSFWEFCSDINKQYNPPKNMDRSVIRSREDLWCTINKTKLSRKNKYIFYRKAYLGRDLSEFEIKSIRETYGCDFEIMLQEIKNAKIIWPIAHIINCVKSDIGLFFENEKSKN